MRRRLDVRNRARLQASTGGDPRFPGGARPGARRLMAGATASSREAIERAADDGPRVRLEPRTIPEPEVAEIFRAADASALNDAEVFPSGALLLGARVRSHRWVRRRREARQSWRCC